MRGGEKVKLIKKISALNRGFTLIELLVVIGIIAILIAVVAIAVNPGRQFGQARDTARRSDISAILSAVYQYAADNNGNLPSVITTTPTNIGTNALLVDLSTTLAPTYISVIPHDPSSSCNDGDTCYVIFKNGSRVTASATGEITTGITLTR